MKKLICYALSLLLVFSNFIVFADSSNLDEDISVEEKFLNAKRSRSNNFSDNISIELFNGNTTLDLDGYLYNDSNGNVTYVFAIPCMDLISDSTFSVYSEGGANWKYDDSYSVYGQVSYNYRRTLSNNNVGYLLTDVSGVWEIKDSRVSIIDRSVIYSCTGLTFSGALNSSQYVTKKPNSNSFYYTTGLSTYVIDDFGLSLSTMGVQSMATLKHGGSVWYLTVSAKEF